ncbi:MAG: hypothetical protein AAGG72_02785 [Pseudomonadota bacterium]
MTEAWPQGVSAEFFWKIPDFTGSARAQSPPSAETVGARMNMRPHRLYAHRVIAAARIDFEEGSGARYDREASIEVSQRQYTHTAPGSQDAPFT